MKNNNSIALLIIMCMIITLFIGCKSIEKRNKIYNFDANGMVIYGTEEQVADTIKQESNKIKSSDIYKQKIIKNEDKKTIVLNIQTFNEFIEHQLIYKILTDNSLNIKTEQISDKDIPILYGETEKDHFEINGQITSINYGGNVQIGEEVLYFNELLVVDDGQWQSIEETTRAIGVIKFQETKKIKMNEINVESGQLVKVK